MSEAPPSGTENRKSPLERLAAREAEIERIKKAREGVDLAVAFGSEPSVGSKPIEIDPQLAREIVENAKATVTTNGDGNNVYQIGNLTIVINGDGNALATLNSGETNVSSGVDNNEGSSDRSKSNNDPKAPERSNLSPEDGDDESLDPTNLNDARTAYINALHRRGKIFFGRREAGSVTNRNTPEQEAFVNNAARNYRDQLAAHTRQNVEGQINSLKGIEDESSAEAIEARASLLQSLIQAQQTEQDEFDRTVMDNDLHGAWVNARQRWNSKGSRIARFGAGGTMMGSTFLIPGAQVPMLIARGTLGAVGGAFAMDSLLEKYGPLAQKGEADRIANDIVKGGVWQRIGRSIPFFGRGKRRQEYQNDLENRHRAAQAAVDELDEDLLLHELGRLQALQIFKASNILNASGTTGDEIQTVIQMIQKRAYTILAEQAVQSVERSVVERAGDSLEAIIALQKAGNAEVIKNETDKERFRRFARRTTGVVVGGAVGLIAGNKIMTELGHDLDLVPAALEENVRDMARIVPIPVVHPPLRVDIGRWSRVGGLQGARNANTFIEASGDLQDQIRQLPPAQQARYSELLGMDREALAQKLGGYRPGFEYESVVIHPGARLELINGEVKLVHADGEVDILYTDANSDFSPEALNNEVWQDAPRARYVNGQELSDSSIDSNGNLQTNLNTGSSLTPNNIGSNRLVNGPDGHLTNNFNKSLALSSMEVTPNGDLVTNIDGAPGLETLTLNEAQTFAEQLDSQELLQVINNEQFIAADFYEVFIDEWAKDFVARGVNSETKDYLTQLRNVLYQYRVNEVAYVDISSPPFIGVSPFEFLQFDQSVVNDMNSINNLMLRPSAEEVEQNFTLLEQRFNSIATRIDLPVFDSQSPISNERAFDSVSDSSSPRLDSVDPSATPVAATSGGDIASRMAPDTSSAATTAPLPRVVSAATQFNPVTALGVPASTPDSISADPVSAPPANRVPNSPTWEEYQQQNARVESVTGNQEARPSAPSTTGTPAPGSIEEQMRRDDQEWMEQRRQLRGEEARSGSPIDISQAESLRSAVGTVSPEGVLRFEDLSPRAREVFTRLNELIADQNDQQSRLVALQGSGNLSPSIAARVREVTSDVSDAADQIRAEKLSFFEMLRNSGVKNFIRGDGTNINVSQYLEELRQNN